MTLNLSEKFVSPFIAADELEAIENEMIQAKTENLKAMKNQEELLDKALKAFRGYSGQGDTDEDEY